MRFPLIGQRRLQISARVDRVVPCPDALAEAQEERRARDAALAQRAHWEQEVITQIGWIK